MGRVKTYIEIREQNCWTLFDTGARNSYVISTKAQDVLVRKKLSVPYRAALGGKKNYIREYCLIEAKIEGLPVHFDAYIIDELGKDETGRKIEVLFGALAMQKWGIRPLPDKETLDLTHYTKEFVEF